MTVAAGNEVASWCRYRASAPRKAVDGLCVVADNGEPPPVGSEGADDLDLQGVHVLVLVDEHMIEHPGHVRPEPIVCERRSPQQQQVVEIDLAPRALSRDVRLEQLGDRIAMAARTMGNRSPTPRSSGAGC